MPGVTRAERELIVGVMTTPREALLAMDALEDDDLEPLRTGRLLRLVLTTDVQDPDQMPGQVLARLTEEERRWVTGLTMSAGVVATPPGVRGRHPRRRLKGERAKRAAADRPAAGGRRAANTERITSLAAKKVTC